MNAVAVGPFVFDGARFAALVALGVFLVAVEVAERRKGGRSLGRWPLATIFGALIAARAGYVAGQWASFAEAPLDAFKLWQGGFSPWAGALGAGIVLGVAALRRRALVVPLAASVTLAAAAGAIVLQIQPGAARSADLPALPFADLAGAPVQLDVRSGRPLVLNLWASWCPPCRREMPMMQDIAARQTGVDMVFANQGEPVEPILGFLDRAGLVTDGILRDPDQALMQRFGAVGLPATLFFHADGSLAHGAVGEISRAELLRRIDQIRPGGRE